MVIWLLDQRELAARPHPTVSPSAFREIRPTKGGKEGHKITCKIAKEGPAEKYRSVSQNKRIGSPNDPPAPNEKRASSPVAWTEEELQSP